MSPLQFKQILKLDQQFPLKSFNKFRHPESYDLHIAIIHQIADKYIALIKELSLENFKRSDEKHRYTPLHLCVMMQNLELIHYIAQKVDLVTPCDTDGWTPLHYAHLSQKPDIIHCMESICIAKEQSPLKASILSCGQIKNLLNRMPAPDNQNLINYQDPSSQEILLNAPAKKFKELTGITFTSQTLVTPEYLLHLKIARQKYSLDGLKNYVIKNYQTYTETPPQLYLAQTAGKWGVFTHEALATGQLVCHYAGKAEVINTPTGRKALVVGHEYSNFGYLINDGLPNVMAVRVTIDDVPDSFVYLALRPIQKGEQLLLDYKFGHPIKSKGPYINQAEKELEGILEEEKGILNFYEQLKNQVHVKHHHLTDFLVAERRRSAFEYLINTPSVLLDFILKDKIYITEIQHLPLKSLSKTLNIPIKPLLAKVFHLLLSQEHLDMMEEFENLHDTNPELYQKALKFLLSLGHQFNVVRRIYFHRTIKNINLEATWSEKNQITYLKFMHALNDEELLEKMSVEYGDNKTTTYRFF